MTPSFRPFNASLPSDVFIPFLWITRATNQCRDKMDTQVSIDSVIADELREILQRKYPQLVVKYQLREACEEEGVALAKAAMSRNNGQVEITEQTL